MNPQVSLRRRHHMAIKFSRSEDNGQKISGRGRLAENRLEASSCIG
jgi:hypothetical protein